MSLILYERLGDLNRRPSPYCWRIRFALAHKGLDADIVALKFVEKDKLSFSGQSKVPVLVDDRVVIYDSWKIACYLEQADSSQKSLFKSPEGYSLARFAHTWSEQILEPTLLPLVVNDLLSILHPDDREYYQQTREAKFGCTFAQLREQQDIYVAQLQQNLELLRDVLREQPYLCGDEPAYADYVIFSDFQWSRCASPYLLITEADVLYNWRERMMQLFNGLAQSVPAYKIDDGNTK